MDFLDHLKEEERDLSELGIRQEAIQSLPSQVSWSINPAQIICSFISLSNLSSQYRR